MRHDPIDPLLFVRNRKRLARLLPKGAVAVLCSNDRMPTNADGVMPYCPSSDLFYLTGIDREDITLLLCPDFPDKKWREVLFVQPHDEQRAKWEGPSLSEEQVKALSGLDTVMEDTGFKRFFLHLVTSEHVSSLFLNTNEHHRATPLVETRAMRFARWCQKTYPLHTYGRLAPLMAQLRSVKDEREIALMQKACDITEKGFRRALGVIRPGVFEYEIEAEYLYAFVRRGARGFAYEPIVASGPNSCILHYGANSRQCREGDLVLMDVGADYAYYKADLTRTVPVSGVFTPRQKEVYNATLRVMRYAMTLLTREMRFFEYQKEVEKNMEEELLRLKLISQRDIAEQPPGRPAFQRYFYHGVAHRIGIDVHDVGSAYAPMQPGSVWTVEPGIYIPEEGFGIRLENNALIERGGVRDLTESVPIEAEDIEDLMRSGKPQN